MLCEKILGKLKDFDLTGKTVEYVDIEWHEAFKRIHRKTTDSGREVGIRLDDSVLTRGLFQGDVIYADENLVIAVNTPPCEVIEVSLEPGHEKYVAKVCYEIGNRHAPLFWGDQEPYGQNERNPPLFSAAGKRCSFSHRRLFPFPGTGDIYPEGDRAR